MGKSYTPTYRIEVKENVSGETWKPMAWRGKATPMLLLNWVNRYNNSLLFGNNHHITKMYREQGVLSDKESVHVIEARVIRQSTNEVEHHYYLSDYFGGGAATSVAPEERAYYT